VWAFVVAAVGILLLLALEWLRPAWAPVLFSAVYYGIAAGALAYSFALLQRGMVFRPPPKA
jgi:hypothetical protein